MDVAAEETAAGPVYVCWGSECPQRQAVWVWSLGNGLHARLELGCRAPMLATEGATKGGH